MKHVNTVLWFSSSVLWLAIISTEYTSKSLKPLPAHSDIYTPCDDNRIYIKKDNRVYDRAPEPLVVAKHFTVTVDLSKESFAEQMEICYPEHSFFIGSVKYAVLFEQTLPNPTSGTHISDKSGKNFPGVSVYITCEQLRSMK